MTTTYEMLNRAEKRLDRNLQNIFWGFVTFTGFHTGLLALCGYLLSIKELSQITVAVLMAIAGPTIQLAYSMTINSYRTKLKANEKEIARLETELNDFQQKAEEEEPNRYFFHGAGLARDIMSWLLLIAELSIVVYLLIEHK